MRVITWIGSWVAVALTGAMVLALIVVKRLSIAHLLIFSLAWAGEYAMVTLTKYAVDRPRPPERLWLVTAHGASFPSGHAANATLVCVTASLVASFLLRQRIARTVTVVVASLVMVAVGFSRVELGVHWTSDVLAGSLVAVAWLAVVGRVVALTATDHDRMAPGISRSTVNSTGRQAMVRACR